MTIMRKTCGSLIALCAAAMVSTGWAQTTDLKSAIAAALDSHPEINQAIENKQAIEFEREQAQGLYLPRVSVEGSAGVRRRLERRDASGLTSPDWQSPERE